MTGVQRPPTRTPTSEPPRFSALTASTLGRPISTPCRILTVRRAFAAGSRLARRATSAPLALPVAGSSTVPPKGENIRAWNSASAPKVSDRISGSAERGLSPIVEAAGGSRFDPMGDSNSFVVEPDCRRSPTDVRTHRMRTRIETGSCWSFWAGHIWLLTRAIYDDISVFN